MPTPPTLSPEQEKTLWDKGELNMDSSEGLSKAVIFYLIKCFAMWKGRELRQLETSHVSFGKDDLGLFVAVNLESIPTKQKRTKRYDDPANPRSVYKIFKKYRSHVANEGPFLVRPISSIKDFICYSPQPLGINVVTGMVYTLMKEAGLNFSFYGNYSLNLQVVDILLRFGTGSHCLAPWLFDNGSGEMSPAADCGPDNCEELNPEICLMISRLLDSPFPDNVVDVLQKIEMEEKNKDQVTVENFDSWMTNLCSGKKVKSKNSVNVIKRIGQKKSNKYREFLATLKSRTDSSNHRFSKGAECLPTQSSKNHDNGSIGLRIVSTFSENPLASQAGESGTSELNSSDSTARKRNIPAQDTSFAQPKKCKQNNSYCREKKSKRQKIKKVHLSTSLEIITGSSSLHSDDFLYSHSSNADVTDKRIDDQTDTMTATFDREAADIVPKCESFIGDVKKDCYEESEEDLNLEAEIESFEKCHDSSSSVSSIKHSFLDSSSSHSKSVEVKKEINEESNFEVSRKLYEMCNDASNSVIKAINHSCSSQSSRYDKTISAENGNDADTGTVSKTILVEIKKESEELDETLELDSEAGTKLYETCPDRSISASSSNDNSHSNLSSDYKKLVRAKNENPANVCEQFLVNVKQELDLEADTELYDNNNSNGCALAIASIDCSNIDQSSTYSCSKSVRAESGSDAKSNSEENVSSPEILSEDENSEDKKDFTIDLTPPVLSPQITGSSENIDDHVTMPYILENCEDGTTHTTFTFSAAASSSSSSSTSSNLLGFLDHANQHIKNILKSSGPTNDRSKCVKINKSKEKFINDFTKQLNTNLSHNACSIGMLEEKSYNELLSTSHECSGPSSLNDGLVNSPTKLASIFHNDSNISVTSSNVSVTSSQLTNFVTNSSPSAQRLQQFTPLSVDDFEMKGKDEHKIIKQQNLQQNPLLRSILKNESKEDFTHTMSNTTVSLSPASSMSSTTLLSSTSLLPLTKSASQKVQNPEVTMKLNTLSGKMKTSCSKDANKLDPHHIETSSSQNPAEVNSLPSSTTSESLPSDVSVRLIFNNSSPKLIQSHSQLPQPPPSSSSSSRHHYTERATFLAKHDRSVNTIFRTLKMNGESDTKNSSQTFDFADIPSTATMSPSNDKPNDMNSDRDHDMNSCKDLKTQNASAKKASSQRRRCVTSALNLGDYFPPGTLIPASSIQILTQEEENGSGLIMKFGVIRGENY